LSFGQTSILRPETKLIRIVHRNFVILLPTLENHILPMFFSLFGSYKALFSRQIGAENLTFSETSQLRLEISLMIVFVHINYVIPLLAIENHVSYPFWPYSALISLIQAKSGLKVLVKIFN